MAAPHQQRLLLRALPVCLQVVCLLLASFSTSALPAAGPKTLVQTKSGSLQGFVERGSRKWLGVPYAEPPVGDLRWRPPQPYKPWGAEPRDATEFKPDCAQFGPGWPSLGETGLNYTSEDCLTMNIFAPLAPVPGGAAVIVFFPAGGYTWGAANDGEMNAYGKSSAPGWQDVVFITVNYRVSIFGFLAHDSLRGRDPAGSTGCYGSQDQREALRWVQSNIAGFGGDPKRVTIFGESAGATSVTTHMVMEKSWGLFQRAMTDSGGFSDWVRSFEDASDVFENITAQLGCTDSKDRITCMVGQPTSMLLDVTDPYYGIVPKTGKPPVLPHPESVLGTQWAPVVDGVEIPKYPQQLLQEGKVAPGVPMLLGSNRDEGSLFREQTDYLASETMFNAWLNATLGTALADEVRSMQIYTPETATKALYKGGSGSVWSTLQADVIGDQALHCPARRAAAAFDTVLKTPAYLYSFEVTPYYTINWPPDLWLGTIGAFHGAEVPFVLFDTFELTGSEVELAASMATFWTNFAKTGDPNLGFHLVADDAMQQQEEEQAQSRRRLEVAGGLASGEAAAVGTLPEQCSPYRGLSTSASARLNGTVQQTVLTLSSVGACCNACAHVFYAQLCNGWRWYQTEGKCELLSGTLELSNSSLPGPPPSAAATKTMPIPPKHIAPPHSCPPPPPPGTPGGPAAGGFPHHAPTGRHEASGIWPKYTSAADSAMRFELCNSSLVAHPRQAQCEFWDKYDCKLKGCLKGILLSGECDTAELLCTRKNWTR